jgi:hypothetical protein
LIFVFLGEILFWGWRREVSLREIIGEVMELIGVGDGGGIFEKT